MCSRRSGSFKSGLSTGKSGRPTGSWPRANKRLSFEEVPGLGLSVMCFASESRSHFSNVFRGWWWTACHMAPLSRPKSTELSLPHIEREQRT